MFPSHWSDTKDQNQISQGLMAQDQRGQVVLSVRSQEAKYMFPSPC